MSSTLETYTRRVRNETVEEITLTERAIARCQTTVQRLRQTQTGFNPANVIERNEAELQRLRAQLAEYEKRLEQIDNDTYSEILQAELDQNRQVIAQKAASTKKRKEATATVTAPRPFVPFKRQQYSSGNRPREFSDRDFLYAEKQFFRDSASLPDHLHDKLKTMPNNMGYVWKDIWFFGAKAAQQTNEYSLLEKRHNQFLVHVYNLSKQEYTLYEKDNTGRRHVIERSRLKPRTCFASIGQLMKSS